MINEANEPSSACRLWRISQVETSTPPSLSSVDNVMHLEAESKGKRSGSRETGAGREGGQEIPESIRGIVAALAGVIRIYFEDVLRAA